MMKKDIESNRIKKDKETVLSTLRNHKEIRSLEIARITGFSSKKVIQVLIGLRKDNKVFSRPCDKKRNVRIWSITEQHNKETEKPYRNLDEEHKEWAKLTKEKVVYNPWGK